MIGLIGLNYKKAPIHIREKFSFTDSEIGQFIPGLIQSGRVEAAIVLSTCNRTEIHFQSQDEDHQATFNFMQKAVSEFKKVDSNFCEYFYTKRNNAAARHLFRVAAGLDSLVLGEDQIIGQIKTAYKVNKEIQPLGKYLIRLFEKSLEAGKKVRANTAINTGASSVSAAAVDTALKHYPKLHKQNVLMIGAGETGALAVQSLEKHGFLALHIANRTFEKAELLAKKYGGQAINIEEFPQKLVDADIVIIATGAQQPVINKPMIQKAMKSGTTDQRLLIDLSVPRNICHSVAEVEGVTLYTVDDLQQIIRKTSQIRQSAVDDAEAIIDELIEEFSDWYQAQKLTPVIIKIKENLSKFSQMQTAEFKGSIKNNEDVPVFSNYLTNKYIGHFIKNLKKAAKNGKQAEFIEFANELFEVEA